MPAKRPVGRPAGKSWEKVTGIRLSSELEERLDHMCKMTNRSRTHYIRRGLELYLDSMNTVLLDAYGDLSVSIEEYMETLPKQKKHWAHFIRARTQAFKERGDKR